MVAKRNGNEWFSMTISVPGQQSIAYDYDNANRLTQITQGTAAVAIGGGAYNVSLALCSQPELVRQSLV